MFLIPVPNALYKLLTKFIIPHIAVKFNVFIWVYLFLAIQFAVLCRIRSLESFKYSVKVT